MQLFIKRNFVVVVLFLFFLSPSSLFGQFKIDQKSFNPSSITFIKGEKRGSEEAATLLADYLKQITKVELALTPIAKEAFQFQEKGFYPLLVQVNENRSDWGEIAITSHQILFETKNEEDLPSLVIYFLEKYGRCQFFFEDCQQIPTKKSIELKSGIDQYAPPFLERIISGFSTSTYSDLPSLLKLTPSTSPLSPPDDFFSSEAKELSYQTLFEQWEKWLIEKEPLSVEIDLPYLQWKWSQRIKPYPLHDFSFSYDSFLQGLSDWVASHPEVQFFLIVSWNSPIPPHSFALLKNLRFKIFYAHSFNRPLGDSIQTKDSSYLIALKNWIEWNPKTIVLYPTYFEHFPLTYVPHLTKLGLTIRAFWENGVKYIEFKNSVQQTLPFEELRNYLIAHLLWNPMADSNQLIQNFCKNYYQEAADSLLNFIYFADNNGYYLDIKLNVHSQIKEHTSGFLSAPMHKSYQKSFQKALNQANNPLIKGRVEKAHQAILFTQHYFQY